MDEVTPTATAAIPTWTIDVEALMASIRANPEGGPPETTNEAERFGYYYAKSALRVERTHKIRFLNPHITTFTLILLASLFLQWPKKTNRARLFDFLAIAFCLVLLSPQHIYLSLLASNLSLFYLSWTLIPGPYSGKTPPNLPDWPTLLVSLPRKSRQPTTRAEEKESEAKDPSTPNPTPSSTQEEGEEEEETCMICWTPPGPSTPLLQLPCTHWACKPCLNLLFPSPSTNSSNPFTCIPTNPPTNSSQSSPLYTCPLCHVPLALNPLVPKIFRLNKARVALYPVATFLYLLAIIYRFRRAEYWESFWPIPFLCLSVLLPMTWFARRVRRDGGRWWVEGLDEGEDVQAGGRGGGSGAGEGQGLGTTREAKAGKFPSFRTSVANLVIIATLVAGKWVEVGLFY
ncbi:hypothetical protein KC333_g9445 [Hortaea werneckii]|nr:hypothetical protein KC333_g9445 [Hortaea werneckii]KAI7299745.1 hypothetical protein KC326_g9425 [Hortaea werneckii]